MINVSVFAILKTCHLFRVPILVQLRVTIESKCWSKSQTPSNFLGRKYQRGNLCYRRRRDGSTSASRNRVDY